MPIDESLFEAETINIIGMCETDLCVEQRENEEKKEQDSDVHFSLHRSCCTKTIQRYVIKYTHTHEDA
jgi:hypothetical protein